MATKLSSGLKSVSLSSDQVPDYSVIAAIDFGTSSSGYAFGFRDKDSDDIKLSDIQLNKWQLGSASSSTDKAPTTVLLRPDKTFDSFGYKAEDKYAKLCDTRRQKGWWYFQRFKMLLYKSKLSREVMLGDAEGKLMSAKEVFAVVIGHLKECVLKDIKQQHPSIKDEDILYVLTVPAIWSDAAKQFMREAATDSSVGITDIQLKLVLEPEAASMFCQQRKSRLVRESNGKTCFAPLEIGHKYILLDLGGGTADIATHEIIENGQLHEIDYARGDDLGGQKFNENFIQFLRDLFGEDTFNKWQLNKHSDYLRMQRAIEGIKWETAAPTDCEDELFFEVPNSLVDMYHEQNKTGDSIVEKLSQSQFACDVQLLDKTQFLMSNNFVRGFFDTILAGVTQHMTAICTNTSDIETVFMVGGLAKSSYVIKYIESMFPTYKCIVPEDPGVAVLKGAVMLGNKPQTIAGRIARFSYGVGVTEAFVEGKHDKRFTATWDGELVCSVVFKKMINMGQVLKYGDTFTVNTVSVSKSPEAKQAEILSDVYQSTSENPSYIIEPGCTEIGRIIQYPPEGGWPEKTKSKLWLVVGGAEFKCRIKDSLGRKYETSLEFIAQNKGN